MSAHAPKDRKKAASSTPIPAAGPTLPRTSEAKTTVHEVPPVVHEVLRTPGKPLDAGVRASMESRFAHDFNRVRIHTDAKAAESAKAVSALAYTVGKDVVFAGGCYEPGGDAGQRLLAHELTHVMQQDGATATGDLRTARDAGMEAEAEGAASNVSRNAVRKVSGPAVLQRAPAPPATTTGPAPYDRAQVTISPISDVAGIGSGSVAAQSISVVVSAAGANHLTWELYNAADELIGGFSTIPSVSDALTRPFVLQEDVLKVKPVEGRYTLRCVALRKGSAIAYADQSFFVWTSTPLVAMDRTALAGIMSAPATRTLGEVGAAKARDMMLEHQQAQAATGTGTVMGNQCAVAAPGGVAKTDCTQYVYDILKYAFGAKGSQALWLLVAAEAARLSGPGGLRGTALQKALETKAGWKGVFWAPSPRRPEDAAAEHPAAYKRVREKGLYSSDDVIVDTGHSVIDFRPKSPGTQPTLTALDQLKKVELGVISARGGKHMTLLINGQVYEVHWDRPPTDPNVIEATPLERWEWESGVVVMPDESFKKAFGP